jgi:hypothetical protein
VFLVGINSARFTIILDGVNRATINQSRAFAPGGNVSLRVSVLLWNFKTGA